MNFKYAICIDLAATCWEKNTYEKQTYSTGEIKNMQEIIEFTAVLYNIHNGHIESEFQEFVRPTERPNLSEYCRNVTGITQKDVNDAYTLPEVLASFHLWLELLRTQRNIVPFGMAKSYNTVIITWSNYDMGTYLRRECDRKRIRRAKYFNRWIDLRIPFATWADCSREISFKGALNIAAIGTHLDVERPYAGIQGARNLAMLVNFLKKKDVKLAFTAFFMRK